MEQSKDDISTPLPGKPGLAWTGVGEEVGIGDLAVGKNPLTGADVPTGIAIAQQKPPTFWGEEKKPGKDSSGDEVERAGSEQAAGEAADHRPNEG